MSKTVTYIRHFKQLSHRNTDSKINTKSLPNPIPAFEYDLILCSPYLRCRQTAELINVRNKPIEIDSNLSEYQGHKKLKLLKLTPSTQQYEIPVLDETWEECDERLNRHIENVNTKNNVKILVITHGIVVNYMQEHFIKRSCCKQQDLCDKYYHMGYKTHKRGRDVPFGKGFTVVIK